MKAKVKAKAVKTRGLKEPSLLNPKEEVNLNGPRVGQVIDGWVYQAGAYWKCASKDTKDPKIPQPFARKVASDKVKKEEKTVEEEEEKMIEEEKNEQENSSTDRMKKPAVNKGQDPAKGKTAHLGSPGNPFICKKGLDCPWVNGEQGPRCPSWHPELPSKDEDVKCEEQEDDSPTQTIDPEEEPVLHALNGLQDKITIGADDTTRETFKILLEKNRPQRYEVLMPQRQSRKTSKGQLSGLPRQPPLSRVCQHMIRVKSLSAGWTFGWQGTRDGQVYQLLEWPDIGFYKLIDPLCPTPAHCPCMRLISQKPATSKQGTTQITCPPTRAKVKGVRLGNTAITSLSAAVPKGMVPHPQVYSGVPNTTAPDPVRSKVQRKRKDGAERKARARKARQLKQNSKERRKFATNVEGATEPPVGADGEHHPSFAANGKAKSSSKVKKAGCLAFEQLWTSIFAEELGRQSQGQSCPLSEQELKLIEKRISGLETKEEIHSQKLPKSGGGGPGRCKMLQAIILCDHMQWLVQKRILDLLEVQVEQELMEFPTTRGGAAVSSDRQLVKIAIEAAATYPGHPVNLRHIIPNNADGNCIFESTSDQLNNSRNCDSNSDFAIFGAGRFPDHMALRLAVVADLKRNPKAMERAGYIGRRDDYEKMLDELLQSKVWNVEAGDLAIYGIAFTTKKNILVYNTNPNGPTGNMPVSVVRPEELGGDADTPVPTVLCYDGTHYEGLVPNTRQDVLRTEELMNSGLNVSVKDIPVLSNQLGKIVKKPTVVQLTPKIAQLLKPSRPKRAAAQAQRRPSMTLGNAFAALPQNISDTCKVCKWEGKRLTMHLNKSANCFKEYDMDLLKKETKKKQAKKEALRKKERREEKISTDKEGFLARLAEKKQTSREKIGKEAEKEQKQKSRKKVGKNTEKEQKLKYKEKIGKEAEKEQKQKSREKIGKEAEKEQKQKSREKIGKEETQFDRRKKFQAETRDGWIYSCVNCKRKRFLKQVETFEVDIVFEGREDLIPKTMGLSALDPKQKIHNQYHICHGCKTKIRSGRVPAMSKMNNLELVNTDGQQELHLTPLENSLIARNVIFQYILQLPKSRWSATKNKVVNVPILEQDIKDTMEALPRTPNEAGIIPVQLKRKLEYKNSHREEYISVTKLFATLDTLKRMGNPYYQNINLETENYTERCQTEDPESYNVLFESPEEESHNDETDSAEKDEEEEEDLEEEYQTKDQVQKHKIDFNRFSVFLDQHAELDVKDGPINEPTAVAPGEGKVPTNITTEHDWEVKTFPTLFPDAKNGIDEERPHKLTKQQYAEQRIQNVDSRFALNPDYLFAIFSWLELDRLNKNIGISFKRGRKKANGQYSLDDPFTVLDNSPGTPRYWQKKKFELLARLENLGAFQLFFTLSCADLLWNENFTAFLQEYQLHYEVINGLEECFVTTQGGETKSLNEFMKEDQNQSKFESVRQNVLSATMHFNHRVQEFFKTIVMSKNNTKMPVKYYNYRVEFQLRGAGHIHGALWLDLEELSSMINTQNQHGREAMDEEEKDIRNAETLTNELQEIFDRIKEEKVGEYHGECDDSGCEKCHDLDVLAWFTDRFITCTLKDPSTRHLAKKLQQHKHFPQSCRKRGTNCRYGAPWFPCLKTIVQVPPRVKFKNEEREGEILDDRFQEMIEEAKQIQREVKEVLEDKEFMDDAVKWKIEEIDQYLHHRDLYQKIGLFLQELKPKHRNNPVKTKDPEVLQDYKDNVDHSVVEHSEMKESPLKKRQSYHKKAMNEIPMDEIRRERLEKILTQAKVPGNDFDEQNRNYERALSFSFKKGYGVQVKRDIDEIFTNTYNPEWIKSWHANMDMQICLDFFAVITYITDYYMKDDSGILPFIKEALKQNEGGSLKEKLKLVKNTFLVKRQVGESELYYKMFPSLHLAHSNIASEFVPTGFKKNRSRFIKQIEADKRQFYDNVIEVEDKEGKFYIEKSGMLEKYERLPNALKGLLSYSQFVKRYEPLRVEPKEYQLNNDLKRTVTESMVKAGDFIYSGSDQLIKLPDFIPLENARNPGEFTWMKRRTARVIRYHKFKRKSDKHEFCYSEMQLFLPFDKEEDLFPDDMEECISMYYANEDRINSIKAKVMPHCKRVEEAREMAETIINDAGDYLDPENQLVQDESELEGVRQHPEYDVLNPEGMYDNTPQITKDSYRKIELDPDDDLHRKVRRLDFDQRNAFDIGLKYCRDLVKAKTKKNPWPTPPLVLVHGGAGTGKSHVIDVLSQSMEKILRTEGDNPNQPYILKTAHTGSAAKIINGQTIHSVFKFAFNDKILSATHKERDKMRCDLQNLKVLIIDEISLVKADMLYQIHFRLSKEIFQNDLPFGGVAVIAFGDIMQIRPVKGVFIFETTRNKEIQLAQAIDDLWQRFSVVNLKTNHRQGEHREYADLLNRARVGELTDKDVEVLKSRVFRREDDIVPKDALIVTGTNAKVDEYNKQKLNDQHGSTTTLTASVFNENRGRFKPPLEYGKIRGSQLYYKIRVKIGCKVRLTANLDVCDGLVNGSFGTVVGFEYDQKNEVRYVMVKFDDQDDGRSRRKSFDYESKYPGATPIEKMEVTFSLSKDFGEASSCANALNFPLCLCYASTAHKIQGSTVKEPNSLILDLDCWTQPAMIYVMLSRIQSLEQLFILEVLPIEKIVPYQQSLMELHRLEALDISVRPNTRSVTSIVSLNTRSLPKHIEDIRSYEKLWSTDVLCLQETWLDVRVERDDNLAIVGKQHTFISAGKGKGLAFYFAPCFEEGLKIAHPQFQIATVKSRHIMVVNVYRSKPARDRDFIEHFLDVLDKDHDGQRIILVVGDFNFCEREDVFHPIRTMLLDNQFVSLFPTPVASHMEGRCLDQAYVKNMEDTQQHCSASIGTSSFSDHDPVFVDIRSPDGRE